MACRIYTISKKEHGLIESLDYTISVVGLNHKSLILSFIHYANRILLLSSVAQNTIKLIHGKKHV